jgi:hypothetical protein
MQSIMVTSNIAIVKNIGIMYLINISTISISIRQCNSSLCRLLDCLQSIY